MAYGFEAARTDDEAGVEQEIQGFGSLLDRVRWNDQVFVAADFDFVVRRICQHAAQRTPVNRVRGRLGGLLRLRCCRIHPVLLESLGDGDCIVSHGLVAYAFDDGRKLRQVEVVGNIIPWKRQQPVFWPSR